MEIGTFSPEHADSHRMVSQDYSHQRDLAQQMLKCMLVKKTCPLSDSVLFNFRLWVSGGAEQDHPGKKEAQKFCIAHDLSQATDGLSWPTKKQLALQTPRKIPSFRYSRNSPEMFLRTLSPLNPLNIEGVASPWKIAVRQFDCLLDLWFQGNGNAPCLRVQPWWIIDIWLTLSFQKLPIQIQIKCP